MQLSFCYSLSRIPFYPFNQFWKRGNSFARMEKVLSPSLYWLTSKIITVAGLIFSSPWSLLSSVAMLKQLVFIWLTSVFCSSGAMTRLKMRKALVFPQGYGFAVFEFGKMFSNNGPKWLCSTRKPVTLTLLALTSLSTSELTATKSCVTALWALLLLNRSKYCFNMQCLSKQLFLHAHLEWSCHRLNKTNYIRCSAFQA